MAPCLQILIACSTLYLPYMFCKQSKTRKTSIDCTVGTIVSPPQPKLNSIPDGDWFCSECVITRLGACNICDSSRGLLLHCKSCSKAFHTRCLNPPLSK